MVDSDSDADDPESEDDDVVAVPYPIEGKYKDEDDRLRYDTLLLSRNRIAHSYALFIYCRILQMPEIEREEIFAQRAEDKRKYEENFKLNQLAQQQTNGDNVAFAAKSLL
jgi:RNA polymerase-associated protein RTF1